MAKQNAPSVDDVRDLIVPKQHRQSKHQSKAGRASRPAIVVPTREVSSLGRTVHKGVTVLGVGQGHDRQRVEAARRALRRTEREMAKSLSELRTRTSDWDSDLDEVPLMVPLTDVDSGSSYLAPI
jgi:hypothetical protein